MFFSICPQFWVVSQHGAEVGLQPGFPESLNMPAVKGDNGLGEDKRRAV